MSNATTQHTPADVRERVVDEIVSTCRTLYPHARGLVAPAAYAAADRIIALLRTPSGEGERGLIMRAMLETFPWSPDIRQEHFERAADAVIAALRSEAAPAPGWSEVRERANMLRAVLREHGFEHLRSALVGQHSDAVCYGQWERHKALLRDLLDALDVALRSEAQGESDE